MTAGDSGRRGGDPQSGLHRYGGRYLSAGYWDDGEHVPQVVDVEVAGDRLAVQKQSANNRVGEGPPGGACPLTAMSEHAFAAVCHSHSFRDVLRELGPFARYAVTSRPLAGRDKPSAPQFMAPCPSRRSVAPVM